MSFVDRSSADDPAEALTQRLLDRAGQYYDEFARADVQVQLLSTHPRRLSTLYRFAITSGEMCRKLIVKVPAFPGAGSGRRQCGSGQPRGRPRLTSVTDPRVKYRLEYAALCRIQRHFERLGDPRFGTIRALDLLPEHCAIVMEEVPDPSLRRLFTRQHRLHRPFRRDNLGHAFRNAGGWLRAYATIPARHDERIAHGTRADFIESVTALAQFLGETLRDASFFDCVASATVARARDMLPEQLPLGLRHGDYTLRNILSGPDGRATGLDTIACWRTPIYQEIAYFLTALKTTRPQVYTLGLAYSSDQLGENEVDFLAGYFGQEPIPLSAIRLFEIQALLNKWAAAVELFGDPASPGGRGRGVAAKLELALRGRFFRRQIHRFLTEQN